jgi:hypothetical protein
MQHAQHVDVSVGQLIDQDERIWPEYEFPRRLHTPDPTDLAVFVEHG